ncbi:MAG: DUF2834 domain-containing protein [Gammaproteobacteria bacterium]|nr:DUF2834 domain-containing protein [Gammaproteobacteria bacterium]
MKHLYLALAVVGAVVPYVFFLQHIAAAGPDPVSFAAAAFATLVGGGVAADLLVSSLVFWVYLFAAGEGARAAWLIPVNLLIGLSCALPLYLYVRARAAG